MRPDRLGLGIALALHALAAAALLSYAPARSALLVAAPIMVELIAPPKAEAPTPAPTVPPKARAVARQVAMPLPQVAIPASTPAVAPPEPPVPPVSVKMAEPAPLPAVAAPAPVTLTAPLFSADYLANPAPAYPAASRRYGEQGRVILRVHVDELGAADDVQVRDSSGYPRLDAAARDTVRRWKFAPARHGAEPVPAWVLVPISFRLES